MRRVECIWNKGVNACMGLWRGIGADCVRMDRVWVGFTRVSGLSIGVGQSVQGSSLTVRGYNRLGVRNGRLMCVRAGGLVGRKCAWAERLGGWNGDNMCIDYRCGGGVGDSIVYGRWWWCFFPCVRGSWENVRKFITLLCFFFFFFFFLSGYKVAKTNSTP